MEYEKAKKQGEWFRRGVTLFLVISFLSGLYFLSDYANTIRQLGNAKEYFFDTPAQSGQQYLALKPSNFRSTSYQPKDVSNTNDYKSKRTDYKTTTGASLQKTPQENNYSRANSVVLIPESSYNQDNRSSMRSNDNTNDGTANLNSALSGTLTALQGERKETYSSYQMASEEAMKPFASVNASQPQFVYVPPSGDPDEGNNIPVGDATVFLCSSLALYAIHKYKNSQGNDKKQTQA